MHFAIFRRRHRRTVDPTQFIDHCAFNRSIGIQAYKLQCHCTTHEPSKAKNEMITTQRHSNNVRNTISHHHTDQWQWLSIQIAELEINRYIELKPLFITKNSFEFRFSTFNIDAHMETGGVANIIFVVVANRPGDECTDIPYSIECGVVWCGVMFLMKYHLFHWLRGDECSQFQSSTITHRPLCVLNIFQWIFRHTKMSGCCLPHLCNAQEKNTKEIICWHIFS